MVKANKNDKGINLGAIPKRFKIQYLRYIPTGQPLSTIKSKKFTALAVKAIIESPKRIIEKFFKISKEKF